MQLMNIRKRRPLQNTPRYSRAFWATAFGFFMTLSIGSSEARGASASEIRVKYKNAKNLYAEGKYEKAITAFKEVKVLKYHPILDYRIGQCYESLGQLKLAITSYQLYVKYRGKFPPGKNHPTKKEVKTRVDGLKLRLKGAPPPTPDPTPGTPTQPGTETPSSDTPSPWTPTQPGTETPGSDTPSPGTPTQPGTDPDSPGSPNTGKGGNGGLPPGGHHPPPPRRPKHKGFPQWRNVYFGADIGVGGNTLGDLSQDVTQGIGGSAYVFFRPFLYLSVGLSGMFVNLGNANTKLYAENPTLGALGLDVRGHLPLTPFHRRGFRLEVWGSLFAGYAGMNLKTQGDNTVEATYKANGGAVGAGAGVEWFLSRWLSMGMSFRLLKPVLTPSAESKKLDENAFNFAPEDPDFGVLWYTGVSGTIHLFF